MSQQVVPVAVRDTVLDLDDKISYAVLRSGQNISVQKYNALSASSSQMTFSIQVPSTSTILSRNLVFGSTIALTITGVPGLGEYLVNLRPVNLVKSTEPVATYFGADGFAPFPLNQLVQNFSATINNTTVSTNVNEILDVLLRSVDKSFFERWNGSTITQLDKYGSYTQALPQQVDVGDAEISVENNTDVLHTKTHTIPAFNSPFNTFDYGYLNNNITPRNAFKLDSIVGNIVGDGVAARTVVITITVREPVFVSPFLFGERVDEPGLSGITAINITAQMDSSARRAFRWVCDQQCGAKTVTNVAYTNSYIECTYYTPKPSDMIPATVVTPLASYTLYKMPNTDGTVINSGVGSVLESNSIMFNAYPDKIFIYVEDTAKRNVPNGAGTLNNAAGYGIPDCYASIQRVEITLNNQSGLLTTYDATQLFKASVMSGSQQSYDEFSGLQNSLVGVNQMTGLIPAMCISTCGSVLVADFGSIISIAQDYYAAGSLSTVQFQVRVTFVNNLQKSIVPQLNLVVLQSGILSSSNGSSSQYVSGVLTKENVLNAMAVPKPMNKQTLARYVGSGLMSGLKSISSALLPIVKRDVLAPAAEHLGAKVMDRLACKLKR